jgi:hypothetical protein
MTVKSYGSNLLYGYSFFDFYFHPLPYIISITDLNYVSYTIPFYMMFT